MDIDKTESRHPKSRANEPVGSQPQFHVIGMNIPLASDRNGFLRSISETEQTRMSTIEPHWAAPRHGPTAKLLCRSVNQK